MVAVIIDFIIELCGESLIDKAYAGRISTTELVNMIYNFCEVYSGKVMYAYQTQFSKRIIRSVLENDGAEITALFSRQSGKTETIAITVGGLMIILPTLANMPMFMDDPRLQMFKDGFWVGIFAPSQRQAQITYGRMKSRLQCKESIAVLEDPDFRLEFTTSNGQTVALSNGSFCTAISASDGSNIEGESFKFIICEECFVKGTPILTERGLVNIEDVEVGDKVYSFNHTTNKVELKKVVRSFSQPLYGRKIVKITTKSGKTITCTDNHKIFIPKCGGYVRADHLQIGDLMLSYNKDTQESEEMLYDEPNDFRNNARGWKHTLSRQEVLKKSEVYSESVSKTERVRVGQVQSCETPMQSRTKNNSEQRKRRFSLSIYNKMFARGKRVLQSILQKRKESDFEKYTGLNDRRSTSILVSRRRKFFWNDVYSLSRIFSRRKRDFSRLANREVRNNTYSKNGQENKQTISVLQRDREEQVSEVNTSLCDFNNEIQNSHNRCGSTLCSVWENDSSIQTEEDSILFRGLQERTQQTVYEELLQEEIIKIEIEEREEVEVFDLTVEDNHNFFANSILVHNCQDISNYKIRKSIHPMGAAYNATICKIGTATTFKGDFYEAINRNKKEYEQGKLKVRNHFEYNYKVVMKYNPRYAKYIEREKRSLGENSDEFRMSYCVTPETRILTSDLRWVRADSIKVGDKLIGFDENPPKKYGQRKFNETLVEDVGAIERPCYEVTLNDGTKVTCSEEHQWLVFTAGSRTVWKQTKDLVSTDRIYKVCDVWEDLPQDYRLGYLSASFDGEGSICQIKGKIQQITFSQRDNAMLKQVKEYLTDFGFDFNADYFDKRKLDKGQDPVYKLFIKGGKRELLRFLGSVRPRRLLENFDPNQLGTVRCSNGDLGSDIHPRVESIKYVGTKKVIPIRTTSRTYVAEGLASHNCLEWIISRGMFIDLEKFEKTCGDKFLERVESDHVATHVAGIDVGGGSARNRNEADSTIITVTEVDWDNPVLMETTVDEETGENKVYLAYNTYIKDWCEISPEIAEDYEVQYQMIMEYLKNFKVARIVIDATREASLGQRIRANVRCDVVLYTFSTVSKSLLYKHLQTEINTGRARFPMGEKTVETREYKRFTQQMADLQKSYSGSNLVVSHPPERGAHDDYPDSWALSLWGTRDPGQIDNTETQDRHKALGDSFKTNSYSKKNKRTARRR